jgi:hypothetical protein
MQLIFNGGDPLGDCPTSFERADQWAKDANSGTEGIDHPQWRWDCGFKLDYDGPLLRLSSRFYPPKTHYGSKWNGKVEIVLLGRTIETVRFECETLDKLRLQVEAFKRKWEAKLTQQLCASSGGDFDG